MPGLSDLALKAQIARKKERLRSLRLEINELEKNLELEAELC